MAYSDKVVDHYNNPRNVGSFTKDTPGVGTGLVGAPECGDVMKLQIKVNIETGVIEDAKFKTFGCGSAIASSSLATEWLKGRTVDDAAKIKNTDIVNELKLPPVKIHCSVLAEDAKFKTFGCGSAIASSSLATEWLKGRTVDDAAKIKNTDIVNELKLPPVKIHCSVLAEDAIKAALQDYKEKWAKSEAPAAGGTS